MEVGGKFEVRVKEAQKAFMDTNEFFGAYATMDKVELLKLISDAHVRTVMWIHGKKALTGSRKEFGSLDAILSHLHDAVAKHMASAGRTLPPWPMLKNFKAKEVNVQSKSGMRTITNDASIADIDFETRGFKYVSLCNAGMLHRRTPNSGRSPRSMASKFGSLPPASRTMAKLVSQWLGLSCAAASRLPHMLIL